MSRIACLRIPKFQIVVHQKYEPELRDKPFALIGGRSRVMLCSPEAAKRYVRTGMRLSEARAACSELLWRDYDDHLYIGAQKEMLANLVSLSPRVSSHQVGVFLLDASGLSLLGGENYFARSVIKFVSQKGYLESNVGIADSAFAAIVAAQNRKRRWYIVEPGNDRQFLSALSIDLLPVKRELKETLCGLGIERLGQLTALPPDQIVARFENEGLLAYNLACGIDTRRPSLPILEQSFQCYVDIGGPVESLNDTLFVIKSMLERLTQLLQQEGLCAEEIVICFYSDDELIEERPVRLIRSSNQSKFLLEVLRLSIENKKLEREFTSLRLIVSRTTKEIFRQIPVLSGDENGIPNEDNGVSSESFLLLVQKLNTRYGTDNALVKPVAVDQYTADKAGAWQPVISSKKEVDSVSSGKRKGKNRIQGSDVSIVSSDKKRLAIAVDYVKESAGSSALVSGLVLKKHISPLPVFVEFQNSKPQAFTSEGRLYKIHSITNPECISGLWWEAAFRKSYYTALVQPASINEFLLVMLVYDHECRTWFVEGEYD
ncbi:MAG: DNA polymerase Y family protein [Candidatus Melainabacteria bacterium]|nr:DNA polymerase Y family protein [Candidatus Melainabacteria bacterium]